MQRGPPVCKLNSVACGFEPKRFRFLLPYIELVQLRYTAAANDGGTTAPQVNGVFSNSNVTSRYGRVQGGAQCDLPTGNQSE